MKSLVVLAHLILWLLFGALIWGFVGKDRQGDSIIFEGRLLIFLLIYAACFYFNAYWLFPRLYLQNRVGLYVGISIILLFAFVFLKPFEHLIMAHQGPGPGQPPPGLDHPPHGRAGGPRSRIDIVSIVLFLLVWSIGTSLMILRRYREQVLKAGQAETLRVKAELLALRSQVNPHFLFNTLNNIYSMSVTGHERTSESILKLSELMRYLTDDAGQDFVPLGDELQCIRNYVELQQLRLDTRVMIDLKIEGDPSGRHIAPLILMNFVENMFKHGISGRGEPQLRLHITVTEEAVSLMASNPVSSGASLQLREGRGLAIARRRLELAYPDQYSLQIHKESDTFNIALVLRS